MAFYVRPYIYGEDIDLTRYITVTALCLMTNSIICFMQNASGYKYAVEFSSFKDNEKILNGFCEGVFIIE